MKEQTIKQLGDRIKQLEKQKSINSSKGRPRSKLVALRRVISALGGVRENRYPSQKQRVKEGRGRPRGVYKHISPLTGKPVPAPVYYSHIKGFKRQASKVAEQRDLQAIRQLSRKGIPPAQAKAIIDRGQLLNALRQQQIKSMPTQPIQNGQPLQQEIQQEVRDVPQEGAYNYTRYPYQLKYKVVTDLMTGRKILKPIPPRERWTYA